MNTGLPEPKIIENISYNNEYNNLKVAFQSLKPTYRGFQDSDVVMIVFQILAALVIDILVKINTAAKSVLLAFAQGSFLDSLGIFWGVYRAVIVEEDLTTTPPIAEVLEDDDSFRAKIYLAIESFVKGATVKYYEFYALEADFNVESATAYKQGFNNPFVYVAIKSKDNDGVPSPSLLAKVEAYLNKDDIRSVNDKVIVVSAEGATLNVEAVLTLLVDAPSTTLADIEVSINEELEKINVLGRDITRTWVIAKLNGIHVYSVNLLEPTTDIIVSPNQFVKIGTVTLTEAPERMF
jgi:phage-related baseplate assembly protein